jgi:hypothetical protein
MISRGRLRFVIFFVTASLIVTIQLRIEAASLFNRYRMEKVRQDRLRQQLWQKQLELECLIGPQQILQSADREGPR